MGKGESESFVDWVLRAASAGALVLVGLVLGLCIDHVDWKQECIRRGVAQYNPQSGAWEWTVERKAEADSK